MKKFLKENPILSLILFLLPGLITGICFSILYSHIDPDSLRRYLASFGYGAAGVFILLFTVRTFLVFAPYYMMLMVGGSIFGRGYGLLYNFIAVFISASLAFVLSRFIRNLMYKKFPSEKYDEYTNLIEKHGFKILLFMRLAIIFPFDIINLAAATAGMRYRKFIIANVIGVIPEVVFLTIFGQSLRAPRSLQFVVLAIIMCTVVLIGVRFKQQIQNWIQSIQ